MKQKTITFSLVLLVGTVGIVGIGINNVSATKNIEKYKYTRNNPSPERIVYSSIQEYSTFNQNNGKIKNYNDVLVELGYKKITNEKNNIMDKNTSTDSNKDKSNEFRYVRETLSPEDIVYSSIKQYSTFQDHQNNKNQDYNQIVRELGFERTQ